MSKEKRILSYFLSWLLVGYIIFVIGSNNVFAATYYLDYSYSQKYYDNNGSSVTAVNTTWNESLQSYVSDDITTAASSYGAGISITSPIPILENHTYTLSISFVDRNNIALSSKNHLAFSSTLQGAANNYANGEYENDLITSSVSNNSILNFAFTARRNGTYIFIPWTTTSTLTQSYVITQIIMEDLGSEGVSIDEINTSLTNQTNELNSSIQNSTNTITGAIGDTENNINSNIDDMEQSIVDSNKETQEVIKDQFNNCRDSYNLFDKNNITDGWIRASDNKIWNETGTFSYTDYINVKPNTTYTLNLYNVVSLGSAGIMEYDSNKNWLNIGLPETKKIITFTTSENTHYIRFTVRNEAINYIQLQEGSVSTNYEPYGEEICSNKIDETNDKLDNIEDTLTDSSPTDMSGLGDSAGWLPAGPVDSILNLPLTMLNNLVSNLSNNCQTISVELPFVKKNINLPCIKSLYDKMGVTGTLFKTAGLIASAFILYNYLLKLYKWVDDTLTMRENTMPGYFDDNWGGGA